MTRLGAEHERRDPLPEPGDLVARLEERDLVRGALHRLDPADRALLWLKVAEALTYEEIADVLGGRASTLRYRFVRALRRLKREVTGNGNPALRTSLLNGGSHAMP